MPLPPNAGPSMPRPEERKPLSVLPQLPPRIARFSDDELFDPSKALSSYLGSGVAFQHFSMTLPVMLRCDT